MLSLCLRELSGASMPNNPEEILVVNVEAIVNGVVSKFPGFVQNLLQPYKLRLTENIVKTSKTYVEAKIKEVMS